MRARRGEFGVWAVLTSTVLGLDVAYIAVYVDKALRGTLGDWEFAFSRVWALTFLLVMGGYALHLTKPRRGHGQLAVTETGDQVARQGTGDHYGEDDELARPRANGGHDDAE